MEPQNLRGINNTYQSYLDQYMDGVGALTEGTKMLRRVLHWSMTKGDLASGPSSAIQQGLEKSEQSPLSR